MEAWEQIEGAKEFVGWFGRWPSFHDAKLRELILRPLGESELQIEAHDTSKDVDDRGYYKIAKRALVKFKLSEVRELEIDGEFGYGITLFGLAVSIEPRGLKINLDPAVGGGGWITAKRMTLEFTPLDGEPK